MARPKGRATTLLLAGKTQVCHPRPPHQVGRPPQPHVRLAQPWPSAASLGTPSRGLFHTSASPRCPGHVVVPVRAQTQLCLKPRQLQLSKSWVLLQDSIRCHSLSNKSISETGHRKPTEGKGGMCTQASSARGSEEQKPASASGSKILK